MSAQPTLWSERVSDLQLSETSLLPETTSIGDAVAEMQAQQRSFLLLVDASGDLSGIFTERDVMNSCVDTKLSLDTPIGAVMNRRVLTVDADTTLREALAEVGSYRVNQLPVMKGNEVFGVLTVEGLIEHMGQALPAELFDLPPHATAEVANP